MLIGSFSPLVKIFQPAYQQELYNDPSLLWAKEQGKGWSMRVYKPSGDYPIKFGVPKDEHNPTLIDWLTGGDDGLQCPETDYTGIIQIPIESHDTGELLAQIEGMLHDGGDPKEAKRLIDQKRKEFRSSIEKAHDLSEARVMRAVQAVYRSIKMQWKANKEGGFGRHDPSITEYLCVQVMLKKHEKKMKQESRVAQQMAAAMDKLDLDAPGTSTAAAIAPDVAAEMLTQSVGRG